MMERKLDPQPASRLFRPGDFRTNASLNYLDNFTQYRRGYQEAADILVDHVEERGSRQDFLLFPIVFLFRHHLELALKELIRRCRMLYDEDVPEEEKKKPTHDLVALWERAKPLLLRLGEGEDLSDALADGDAVFAEFQRFDKTADAFRFAKSTKGKPHLAGFRHINIRVFRGECDGIAKFLDGALCAAEEYLQNRAEMKAEYNEDSY